MITRTYGAAVLGVDPFIVTVEVEIARGLPKFDIVGLAHTAVQEGKNRIVSALRNSGIDWGPKRITVNLAPASIRKEGSALDLAIALGLVCSLGIISRASIAKHIALGELSLDGSLQFVRGSLAVADFAKEHGWKGIILPGVCGEEAALVDGIDVIAPSSFSELLSYLKGEKKCKPSPLERKSKRKPNIKIEQMDWADVRGQAKAKRALEIAASGFHNVILSGPPGVGKTLLAHRFSTILPSLESQSLREVQKIYSARGVNLEQVLKEMPPFRAPHHNASLAGMIGSGRPFRPGELSLAHQGTLFFG